MGYVYFVRHGQTIWNVENKICGATDIALTELGHKQAIETGKKILEEGIKADEILYSPLIRAKDTALHISEITGIPAREELRLKEQNFGRFESTPRDGAEFKIAKGQFITRYDGGESMLHLAQRMLWYLSHYEYLPEGEIVDEMLAILSDRNAIMQKKELEKTNAAWNEFLQHGFEEKE